MKTHRLIYAILFFSDDYDINKCRKMDLMYMAGIAFYGHNVVLPEDKVLAKRLRDGGINMIEIITDPVNKFNLKANLIK